MTPFAVQSTRQTNGPSVAANDLGHVDKGDWALPQDNDNTLRAHAIDTVYQGYRFRSRTEARWAVFFDALEIRWEYEKEGYELERVGRYLPDFWLPDLQCFVEVKGKEPTVAEVELAEALRTATGAPVVIVHGEIGAGPWTCYGHDMGHSSFGPSEWSECWWFLCHCGRAKISWGDGCHAITNGNTYATLPHWCGWSEAYKADACGPAFPVSMAISTTSRAVNAARGARFEYGESGREKAPKRSGAPVMGAVKDAPGLSTMEIALVCGINAGLAKRTLLYFARQGTLSSRHDGQTLRWYPT